MFKNPFNKTVLSAAEIEEAKIQAELAKLGNLVKVDLVARAVAKGQDRNWERLNNDPTYKIGR